MRKRKKEQNTGSFDINERKTNDERRTDTKNGTIRN